MMTARLWFWLALLGALAALFGTQQARIGAAVVQAQRAMQDAEAAKATARRLDAELKFAHVTQRVVTVYVDRVQVVRERGETIIREVPVHVTPQADARCTVPVGFVRVHDGAAENRVPDPGDPGNPDAPAPGIALSTVAATVASNYTTCHEVREQLISLQDWVREILAAATEHAP